MVTDLTTDDRCLLSRVSFVAVNFYKAINLFFTPQIPAASLRNYLLPTFALLGTVFFVTARLNVSYAGID